MFIGMLGMFGKSLQLNDIYWIVVKLAKCLPLWGYGYYRRVPLSATAQKVFGYQNEKYLKLSLSCLQLSQRRTVGSEDDGHLGLKISEIAQKYHYNIITLSLLNYKGFLLVINAI